MDLIIGISGSPRKNGNTDILLNEFLLGVNSIDKKIEIKRVFLRDYEIKSCIGCELCRKEKICTKFLDGMQILYPLIERAKGIIIGSPAYNYNVTSFIKSFIDRLYCYYDFTNDRPRKYKSRLATEKRFSIVYGVCEQISEEDMGFTTLSMEKSLSALGYNVIKRISALGFFDKGSVKNDAELLAKVYQEGAIFSKRIITDS